MDIKTHVYIIGEPDSWHIKIGVARNVTYRLSQLQIGNPRKLEELFSALCPNKHFAQQVEFRVHTMLHRNRLIGEWFDCPMEEARWRIEDSIPYIRDRRYNLADKSYLHHRDFGGQH